MVQDDSQFVRYGIFLSHGVTTEKKVSFILSGDGVAIIVDWIGSAIGFIGLLQLCEYK
jgi:hypothetical protein